MSEALLKAILRLFAVVAKEGDVTRQERDQIKNFLEEHLSKVAVDGYLKLFDEYTLNGTEKASDPASITRLCDEINPQLTQKQKIVILLELTTIIQADGS